MTQKVDLIRQALSASESSIKLARTLLNELEKEGVRNKPKNRELPGTVGMFDGQDMVTEKGETFPVPENYASKSILVVGDTLKLVEQGKEKRFKQIEHVKRHKTTGILSKKDGKWVAVTSEGSYRVLPAAVEHFKGDVGDEVLLQLPANNLQTVWGAIEKVTKKESRQEETTETKETKETKGSGDKRPVTTEVRKKTGEQREKNSVKEVAAREASETKSEAKAAETPDQKETHREKTAKEPAESEPEKAKVEPKANEVEKEPARPESESAKSAPAPAKAESDSAKTTVDEEELM